MGGVRAPERQYCVLDWWFLFGKKTTSATTGRSPPGSELRIALWLFTEDRKSYTQNERYSVELGQRSAGPASGYPQA